MKNDIVTLKYYLKQDNIATPPPHNIILFDLDLNVKFPLLRLLQFLSDLKSTIFSYTFFIKTYNLLKIPIRNKKYFIFPLLFFVNFNLSIGNNK